MPSSEITMELPNDIIGLNYGINYGQTTVQFVHYINKNMKYVGKSQFLNKKQIDKIFGKNSLNSSSSNDSTETSRTANNKKSSKR
jgi:hypothetical protein